MEQRAFVLMAWFVLVLLGVRSAQLLPIDAVPDITSNQVQINTLAPAFAPAETERFITVPLEMALQSLPRKQEIRSISQFGLSQVTVTFEEGVDLYWARQLVLERLQDAQKDLPDGISPELGPVATGLGEIVQFSLEKDGHPDLSRAELIELTSLLNWTIAPQLRSVPGVIEVNSYGGWDKQYEIEVQPSRLKAYGLTLDHVLDALRKNNENVGGGYLENGTEQVLIRGVGLLQSVDDIGNVVVAAHEGRPVLVKDLAQVRTGAALRSGAASRDGHEAVLGLAVMLKGENSRVVTTRVKERLDQLQSGLPPGVRIRLFYDRATLVDSTIHTAGRNLLEGGLLVTAVLFLFLLQLRAGLIVSAVIPLAMLVAIIGMQAAGVSANLMSLGAIDFGLIVDAAVIIVENCVRRLNEQRSHLKRPLTSDERQAVILEGTLEVRRASQFGELIILAAYLPILNLVGTEGKMFRPMALAVIFALLGALALSLTLIPALCSLFLRDGVDKEHGPLTHLRSIYARLLDWTLRHSRAVLSAAALLVLTCTLLATRLGAEFLPELDEGALAINHVRISSVSVTETLRECKLIEQELLRFPEVDTVVSRIGRPAIASDPMGPQMVDTYVMLKPRAAWPKGSNRERLVERMQKALDSFPGVAFSFSQPIKFRMLELIEGVGVRSDVAVKIHGDDLETLDRLALSIGRILQKVPGAADVSARQNGSGLPVLEVLSDRAALARLGLNVADVNQIVESARSGTRAGTLLEGFTRVPLIVKLPLELSQNLASLSQLELPVRTGQRIRLNQVATLRQVESPQEISRENGLRRSTVEANVRSRDVGSFVVEARQRIAQQLRLPTGYTLEWSGMYERLESGRNRLLIVVPLTFLLIFLLLQATFGSFAEAVMVFTGIPLALTGSVLALVASRMPFSMSAGVGFVAVSGVAVLNGLVLLSVIVQHRRTGKSVSEAVREGPILRFRPVLMTATVAVTGFLPMIFSTGTGAEIQRPLAVVVVGGILSSTLLTLFVLPALYREVQSRLTR